MKDLSKIDPKHNIIIKGAKLHNLKNVDVVIPRNKFTVITGLSGSGKSSLAYDTLYAEGQRRYVESLSSYARQFMGKLNKPKVDYIKGISPAIAISNLLNEEMFKKSLEAFLKEKKVKEENTIVVFEITLSNLRSTGDIDDSDYLDRAKLLCSMGHKVMISNFSEYFKLVQYLTTYTKKQLGLTMGVRAFKINEVSD